MYGWIKYIPLSALRKLAGVLAFLSYYTNSNNKKAIETNLALLDISGDSQTVQHILYNQLSSMAESLKVWAMPPCWAIKQIHTVHNEEILQQGINHPNGMLAIVPHIGTWEMMNAWLNQFGSPTIMYKPIKGTHANAFVLKGRERLNARLVPTNTAGVKAIFKTLKAGGFSIILPDHVPDPSGGVVVPFFGIPTITSTLAPKLAQKTKCALVGLTCTRRPNGQFDIHCYKLTDTALYDKDINTATAALNCEMQKMINKHFFYYMWGYRRFKHTPLADNLYGLSVSQVKQKRQAYFTFRHHKAGAI